MLEEYTPKEEFPILTMESKIPFGKLKDKVIKESIIKSPQYMRWFRDIANIDDEVFKAITISYDEWKKEYEWMKEELMGMTLADT